MASSRCRADVTCAAPLVLVSLRSPRLRMCPCPPPAPYRLCSFWHASLIFLCTGLSASYFMRIYMYLPLLRLACYIHLRFFQKLQWLSVAAGQMSHAQRHWFWSRCARRAWECDPALPSSFRTLALIWQDL